MLVDNHVHLYRQPYRLETIQQCVAAARSHGVMEVGFVEHCTAFRSWWEALGGWWVGRDTPAVEDYYGNTFWPTQGYRDLKEFQDLIQTARNQGLPVRFGVEVDYIEDWEDTLRDLINATPWDLVIGSVHTIGVWCFNHYGFREEWARRDVDEAYCQYFYFLEKLVRSRLCDVIAHPDLIKLFSHRPSFDLKPMYRRIAKAAAEVDVAVEANAMGWNTPFGEMYPSPEFLHEFQCIGVPISLASDAHEAEDMGKGLPRLQKILQEQRVDQVCRFDGRVRTMVDL